MADSQHAKKQKLSDAEKTFNETRITQLKATIEERLTELKEEQKKTGVLLASKVEALFTLGSLIILEVFDQGLYEEVRTKIETMLKEAQNLEKIACEEYSLEIQKNITPDSIPMLYGPYAVLLTNSYPIHEEANKYKKWNLVVGHTSYISNILTNPSLQESISGILSRQSELLNNQLSTDQESMIHDYCLNEFQTICSAFETVGDPLDYPKDLKMFMSIFDACKDCLPEGYILFEGQGLYDKEFIQKQPSRGDLIQRKRPTSTSIFMHSALYFVSPNKIFDPPFDQHTAISSVLAPVFRKVKNEGCLIVHTIKSQKIRGIFRFLMKRSIFKEGEVILQPNLMMKVVDIKEKVLLPDINPNNNPFICDIIYTELTTINET